MRHNLNKTTTSESLDGSDVTRMMQEIVEALGGKTLTLNGFLERREAKDGVTDCILRVYFEAKTEKVKG